MDPNNLFAGLGDALLPGAPSRNLGYGLDGLDAFFDFQAFEDSLDAEMLDAEPPIADTTLTGSQLEQQSYASADPDSSRVEVQTIPLTTNARHETNNFYNTETTHSDDDSNLAAEIRRLCMMIATPPLPPWSTPTAALDLGAGTWLPGLPQQDESDHPVMHSVEVTLRDSSQILLPDDSPKESRIEKSTKDGWIGTAASSKKSRTPSNAAPKRACISSEAKMVLDTHFDINPYPKEHEITSLLHKTKLTGRTIKTWFSNTRSRRGVAMFSNDRATEAASLQSAQNRSPMPSPVSSITKDSLEILNQLSPTSSMISLERYLSEPMSDESDSEDALEPAAHLNVDHKNLHKLSGSTLNEVSSMHQYGVVKSQQAKSIADSEASFGSFKSLSSHNSIKTVDSRGCRRGRKRWFRAHLKSVAATKKSFDSIIEKDEKNRPRFFCTWPSCSATFRHRYEWVRHEEALHYQPNHWICCLGEAKSRIMPSCIICGKRNATLGHMVERHSSFDTCINKCQDSRTFFREDQLVQHIKSSHLGQETTKRSIENLLCNWKIVNPTFNEANLKCGFCGLTLDTWEERQQHVSKHLQSGICKLSWWPERLPVVPAIASINRNDPFTCPNCSISTANFTTAFFSHSHCITYSCRNLHDLHAAFLTTHFGAEAISSTCRLCDWAIAELDDKDNIYLQRLAEHADTHGLRDCDQDVFTSPDEFVEHLNSVHGAKWTAENDLALEAWRCDQNLVQSPKGCCVQTKLRSHGRPLCSTDAYYQVAETPCV